ncbi:amidohydrolase family protein, partial [Streptomyces globisporus]|uniref:amidohydrolase family protein n=1 Tax=Streptomyces globisporus TaxID=1908 RepID=UPI0034605BBB
MLISGRRVLVDTGTYLDDGAVLIEGDSIVAVGPRKEIEERTAADVPRSVFDGTLLPGLIDAHVHLVFDGSPDPVSALQDSTDEALLADMRRRAEELLLSGVTTARDLGDRNGLALRLDSEIADRRTPGPRIVSAGTPLTTPGGHCHFLGGEVSGEAEIRALIRLNLERGAGVIKCMVTGGGLTRGGPASHESQFSAAELRLFVDEAHAAGVPVAAHAHGADGIAA